MNRFIIEDTPSKIASSLCDQHIVKMPLEETQMLCTVLWQYTFRYNKIHGASKHKYAIQNGYQYLPKGGSKTKHPQCFSGHDDLKTDEFMPIEAYRKFYIVDKSKFARYKYTEKPKWMENNELKIA